MKKRIKRHLTILFAIPILMSTHSCFFYSEWKAKRDGMQQSVICDTVPYVTEQPEITFRGFQLSEIDTVRFQIRRDSLLIKDTLVKAEFTYTSVHYASMKIPYEYFLKSDTIAVATLCGLHYYISGYRHYAHLHYGMFGYVGSWSGRFSPACVVNGEVHTYKGELWKDKGIEKSLW